MTQAKQRKPFPTWLAAVGAWLWLSLVLVSGSGSVTAATVSNLYTVQVPVEGSSPAQLQQGYRDGLEAVLLRVSGSRAVFDNPDIEGLLDDAESLLQSYQFLRGEEQTPDQVRMTFGSVGVTRALAEIGAPVWGGNRPLTLAWIAVEEQGSRTLVAPDGDTPDPWATAFRRAAAERGLPLAFPAADAAADRRMLSDVWGQFMGSIREASRVDHEFLAAIRVSGRSGGWQAAWVLEGAGVDESANLQAASPDELARAVVNAWANMMASRYAVSGGDLADATRVQVVVDGVHSVTDFGRVRQAVSGMDPVTSFGVAAVRGDRLVLRLGFSGELEQLREYIALDERFQLATDAEPLMRPATPPVRDSDDGAENDGRPEGEGSDTGGSDSEAVSDTDRTVAPVGLESLYETLYYRWRGGSPVSDAVTEPAGGGQSGGRADAQADDE